MGCFEVIQLHSVTDFLSLTFIGRSGQGEGEEGSFLSMCLSVKLSICLFVCLSF